ncbi:MAG: glycoside hydrolase family 15 protein [Nitrospinae bacterium]|nr:glycoside hydrolase family 15 protein [Nitrospinota bacterium]
MYDYGLIGNCQTAALVSRSGSIDWLCFPRPDSPPVFGRLLDEEGGCFSIEALGKSTVEQSYISNTNILLTRYRTENGAEFTITDFCPRFVQFGRMFRPLALFRIVEPVGGSATVRVRCKPVSGWEKEPVPPIRGSSHLRFETGRGYMRLATNMPLTYLSEEVSFVLKETLFFGLSWGYGIEDDIVRLSRQFLDQTAAYWRKWVQHCSIPVLYQKETIRSALALKLHCYEDTGAILAALTTSLPENPGEGRNWDYRFCWLRDAYFVLSAFHKLGHFEEMEEFLKFLLDIASHHEYSREKLRPVYSLDQSAPLPEREHPQWAGYGGSKPVRSNNQAAEHVQNDVYGETILTLTPIFLDERFQHLRTRNHEDLLIHLTHLCVRNIGRPDAGLWELRNGWREHSFSNLMIWAGLERASRIKESGFLRELNIDLAECQAKARQAIESAVKDGSLRNGATDASFDSASLLLPLLRYPDRSLCQATVNAIARELRYENNASQASFLYRYVRKDDFGRPSSSFLICSFWLAQAFARLGQMTEARKVMEDVLQSANHLGLLSEHYRPEERRQCGNFPQAYSHVGLINAAFETSPSWDQVM